VINKIINMSRKINQVSHSEIPKLSYDPSTKRSNIYDVERALDSYVQENYVTLYDCIGSKKLAAVKLPNRRNLSIASSSLSSASPPDQTDGDAAPTGSRRVDIAVLAAAVVATLCYDSACSLAETSHIFHSQTETTKQTTLQNMLDSDGSVHLETNGQTFIYLLQSLGTFASDSCHLLANVLRLWAEAF
jgi:hypothetical protein